MRSRNYLVSCIAILGSLATQAKGQCRILGNDGKPARNLGDVLAQTHPETRPCTHDVFELRHRLLEDGLVSSTTMVANRGRHNPRLGSFSLFEMSTGESKSLQREVTKGDFFFGHFTQGHAGAILHDQSPRRGALMVEAIAWDYQKSEYNFYELIGNGKEGVWRYRGDTSDVLADNSHLYLSPDGPNFGSRLRCSACHVSGGPIMKELEEPHNDWWRSHRPLPLGENQPSSALARDLATMRDASILAEAVDIGIKRVTEQMFATQSLQSQLRPLFCTLEINLVSSPTQHGAFSPHDRIQLPRAHFANPLLGLPNALELSYSRYANQLQQLGFSFPETDRRDADHPWLTPVKGRSDLFAIEYAVQQELIDEEFVADVLAVGMDQPLFSRQRCNLLRLVPVDGENWREQFITNLEASQVPAALELAQNLTEAERNLSFHRHRVERLWERVQSQLDQPNGVHNHLIELDRRRRAVFQEDISKNPMGQILEPGFRVIFPRRPR